MDRVVYTILVRVFANFSADNCGVYFSRFDNETTYQTADGLFRTVGGQTYALRCTDSQTGTWLPPERITVNKMSSLSFLAGQARLEVEYCMEQVGCLADVLRVALEEPPAFSDLGHYADVSPQQKAALARASAQGYNGTLAGLVGGTQADNFDAFYETPFSTQFVGQLGQGARAVLEQNFVFYGPQMMSDAEWPGARFYADLQAFLD